jgi:hypothetical protein
MTTPTPNNAHPAMTRAILIAGLLGGLLGGAVSFVATRYIKPAETPRHEAGQQPGPATTEAREIADGFVKKLRSGKFDEFANDVKVGSETTDEDLAKIKARLTEFRTVAINTFGASTGEFEVLKETALSPSLCRLVYLEKLERGGVWWVFVLYRGKETWRLAWVDFGANLHTLFGNL